MISIRDITKTYQNVTALDSVSLDIKKGEVHALVGENGAGKSTLIKILSGYTQPDKGTFTVDGHSYEQITPRQAMDAGIGVIHQEQNLIADVSVAENVFLGDYQGNGVFINRGKMKKKTEEVFSQLGVQINPSELVGNLSTAQMQMVSIAKAIVQDVKVLILDEPTAPLTNHDAGILFQIIERLKARQVTILYISHRLEEIYELADRITVMRDGKIIETKQTEELPKQELIRLMVGRRLSETYPARNYRQGETVLKVESLSGNIIEDVSFTLHKGEILGIAGLVGSGRTELVRMLFGADKIRRGKIELNGNTVRITSPEKAVRLGMGFVPEDRKAQGVLMERSIKENMSLPLLRRISHFFFLDKKKEDGMILKYKEALNIKTPSLGQQVRNLSGGNQQKVVIGKWLASSSQILILDEPTQGIDVGAKYEIYQMMNRLTENGISIIMISSEMEEIIGMSDRIIVLHEGSAAGTLNDRKKFTQEKIMKLASGEGGFAAC